MHHIQENIIFCSTHAVFDEGLFPKCTDSHAKEHKLYDKLLDKISPETEWSVSDPFGKNRPTPVPTLNTLIPHIQNNPPNNSSSLYFSYKSTSPSPTLKFKNPTVEIEKDDGVDPNIKI